MNLFKDRVDETSKVFYVRVDPRKKVTIRFGDGVVSGYDPTGDKIAIIGLETVGADGNIGENVLSDTIISSLYFDTTDVIDADVEEALLDLLRIKSSVFFSSDSASPMPASWT